MKNSGEMNMKPYRITPEELRALVRDKTKRCVHCGWPLGDRTKGCARDDCSQRPMPELRRDYQVGLALLDAADEIESLRRSLGESTE